MPAGFEALAPIKAMLQTHPAPRYWLEAQSHDGAGFDTRIIIAYWQNAEFFADWRRATETTFGQAYFSSLAKLEHWAEHHPSHLAILTWRVA